MRRPGPFPGRLKPRIALFSRDTGFATVPVPQFWASASSGQITINSWFVYDATTGPVLPPSGDAREVLLDTGIVQRRQLSGALASATIDVVGASGQFLPQFVPQWSPFSDTFARLLTKKPFPQTVDVARSPSIDVTLNPLDTGIIQRRILNAAPASATIDVVGASGQFLPNFVSQWHELAPLVRVRTINAAVASSTDAGLIPAAAATASTPFASASTGQITINTWSIYDPSTGPVLPPPAPPPAQTLVDAPSDIRRLRPPTPFIPTQIVCAIPVDDLWFEALDVPIRIKGKSFDLASSTADVIFQPPAAPPPPQVLPDATVFARLKVKRILDESSAPVAPPLAAVAPPTLGADWLESTARVLSARKVLSDTIDAIFPFPAGAVPVPPPPDHGGGHGHGHWRTDFGLYWRYRPLKKKKDIRAELEAIETAVEEELGQEADNSIEIIGDPIDELTERSQRLIEAIEAATRAAKAKAEKKAFQAMQVRAIEARRKIAEEEEEQAAWLLLHLL